MHALTSRFSVSARSQARVQSSNNPRHSAQPALRTRTPKQRPAWPQLQHSTYYYDAAHQSALTLRTLLKTSESGKQLGNAPAHELTVNAVHRLLASLCPREDDDSERHAYFSELMSMHLSELTSAEIQSLKSVLKKSGFDGVLSSSVVDEARYREWDFSKGSLQPKTRSPMSPEELYKLLDELAASAAAAEKLPQGLSPVQAHEARNARNCLTGSATAWAQSGKTLPDMVNLCAGLAASLGLAASPQIAVVSKLPSRGNVLVWKDACLVIDQQFFQSLASDDGRLFNHLLRDMLELLLTRMLFGEKANPSQLSAANKKHLRLAMDEVMSQSPAAPAGLLRSSAARLLSQAGQLGKLQIMPGSGGALGHAWLGHDLSIVPDKTQKKQVIGTHYMRTALRLEPDDCTVKQWPIRWLSAKENEALHPQTYAWQITVPVEAARLQEAAVQVATEWKEEALPFRFIGTTPAQRGTGCRVSVLRAIEQGMEPEAKALFEHFNAGLAEPDSPTEIANRMNQFMEWVRQSADGQVM